LSFFISPLSSPSLSFSISPSFPLSLSPSLPFFPLSVSLSLPLSFLLPPTPQPLFADGLASKTHLIIQALVCIGVSKGPLSLSGPLKPAILKQVLRRSHI